MGSPRGEGWGVRRCLGALGWVPIVIGSLEGSDRAKATGITASFRIKFPQILGKVHYYSHMFNNTWVMGGGEGPLGSQPVP